MCLDLKGRPCRVCMCACVHARAHVCVCVCESERARMRARARARVCVCGNTIIVPGFSWFIYLLDFYSIPLWLFGRVFGEGWLRHAFVGNGWAD